MNAIMGRNGTLSKLSSYTEQALVPSNRNAFEYKPLSEASSSVLTSHRETSSSNTCNHEDVLTFEEVSNCAKCGVYVPRVSG